jgi:hypothetical protein
LELKQIASSIQLDGGDDTIIWQFNSSDKYYVQSLHAVVNDRGVRQIFTPVVWKVPVPSRLHVFLWLLCNNKVLTRDNLAKRRKVDNMNCLFCNEQETVSHLFFDCCVVKVFWKQIVEVCGKSLGTDFQSVAKWWLHDKKIKTTNVCTTAALWAI